MSGFFRGYFVEADVLLSTGFHKFRLPSRALSFHSSFQLWFVLIFSCDTACGTRLFRFPFEQTVQQTMAVASINF